ncbi:MAG: LptF/LptG family permease [bacterium]
MPRILQRYVLKELIGPTILGLFVFTFLLLIRQIFRLADFLLNSGIRANLVFELLGSYLPALLSITIPMAFLVGVLLSAGRLSQDNEIKAMRVVGINLFWIFLPVLIMGAVLSLIMFWANLSLMPRMALRAADQRYQLQFEVMANLEPGRFYDQLDTEDSSAVLFFPKRDPVTGQMRDVNIKVETRRDTFGRSPADSQPSEASAQKPETKTAEAKKKPMNKILIMASKGGIESYPEKRLIQIHLFDGSIHVKDPETPRNYTLLEFSQMTKDMYPVIEVLEGGVYDKAPEEMTLQELRNQIKTYTLSEKKGRMAKVEKDQRFSIPLACLAFALIGFPLGIYMRPSGKSAGFAIAIALIFIYYWLLKWGSSLGKEGGDLSTVVIFSPNVILSVLGLILIIRMVRR